MSGNEKLWWNSVYFKFEQCPDGGKWGIRDLQDMHQRDLTDMLSPGPAVSPEDA